MPFRWALACFALIAVSALAQSQFDSGNSTGLPVYPGATASDHADGRGTVSVSSDTQVPRLAGAAYISGDKPDRVLDFYRKRLKAEGQLVECTGGTNDTVDVQLSESAFRDPSACSSDDFAGTELKLVNASEQKIVVVLAHGGGSEIALVSVRGK